MYRVTAALILLCAAQGHLGSYLGNGSTPAPIELQVKPFPWPPFTLDLAATAAASAFNLLIVFAFLNPVRSIVVTIVREKELRLREGMRILGLTVTFCVSRCVVCWWFWSFARLFRIRCECKRRSGASWERAHPGPFASMHRPGAAGMTDV